MSFSKQLKMLLHPYVFVLKEGKGFPNDSMSFDLMMMQIDNEVIKSPANQKKEEESTMSELELLKSALPRALARVQSQG